MTPRRTPRRRGRRAFAAVLVLLGLALTPVPAGAAPAPAGSPVTVSGTGAFAGLKVTVSQTRDLLNQVVRVSWTGGVPSTIGNSTTGSVPTANYMQIMQCWGDDPAGPRREQCQFGGTPADTSFRYEGGRQLDYGFPDWAEKPPVTDLPAGEHAFVSFQSVTGKTITGDAVNQGRQNDFYGPLSTNEAPHGRTYADGTGEVFFEIQTAREAPGLGCGTPRLNAARQRVGRSCWLVVVPRGDTEVDGSKPGQLSSSPLSQTNWNQRLVVPLEFRPIGVACPIGSVERATAGQEQVAEAVAHWQPALCSATGRVFSYSQFSDVLARNQLASTDPGMVFLSRPAERTQLPAGRSVVYAPVTLSGLTIAFNVQSQSLGSAPAGVKARDGQRITELRLTPRLVAKLLTQSYPLGANLTEPELAKNPADLSRDQDFLQLNPGFKDLFYQFDKPLSEVLEPIGTLDAALEVWEWILADADGRDFLAGKPDPWKMVVNPKYKDLVAQNTFPRNDQFCQQFPGTNQPQLCAQDAHPYAQNMQAAARAASRGDTLKRDAWNNPPPPLVNYDKRPVEPDGQRGILAFADTATVERFSLATASLRPARSSTCDGTAAPAACGTFVAPTSSHLLAGYHAMRRSGVPGVLLPNPNRQPASAYPLTTVGYAATAPTVLEPEARKDYAAFLQYAAGPGQTPGLSVGRLPPGYVPLPAAARAQTRKAATAILTAHAAAGGDRSQSGGSSGGSPPNGGGGLAGGPGAQPAAGGAQSGSSVGAGQRKPAAGPQTPRTGSPALPPTNATTVAVERTPSLPVGWVRWALLGVALLGGVASGAGPVLLKLATRGGR